MATASYFPSHSGNLWMLANATVYDAREVVQELPEKPTALRTLVVTSWAVACSSVSIRGDFYRLADRQGKLIGCLRAAAPEQWPVETCSEMATLLEELVVSEREMLDRAFTIPSFIRFLWTAPLRSLTVQVEEIRDMYLHMDALSVVVPEMPGDADMREFMISLGDSEEIDLSVDKDLRKEISLR